MQKREEQPLRLKMAELRVACDREMSLHRQKIDSAVNSFKNSMQLIRSRAQETVDNQGKLGKLKSYLRALEDDLVKAIAVKTRKEAKRMALVDSLSDTRIKVEELERTVQDQTAWKDEYAAILSQQSEALAASQEKSKQDCTHREDIKEAIKWYNRVLGFRIDSGHGVKFTFTNINRNCPSEEHSFTIRHANNVYTLLECNPQIDGMKELVHELNRTNGFFQFVRMIRVKFQEVAGSGSVPHLTNPDQASSFISLSAPVSSVSTDSRSESPAHLSESRRNLKEAKSRKRASSILASAAASSFRRSPRLRSQIERADGT